MALVDIHAHVYPQKISEKAVAATGNFYTIPMQKDGSVEYLAEVINNSPITHTLINSVATTTKQVASINTFISQSCAENTAFLGLAAMHQDTPDFCEVMQEGKSLGLLGIKIHPDMQKTNIDDERFMRMYEAAEKEHLPIMIHTGDYRYDYSHPARLKVVLHEFPNLVIDAAHFGGWSIFDLALEYLQEENCFVDTSSAFKFLGRRRSRELIELYGADRVLFGSDFPMWNPSDELEFLKSLELSALDFEKITWRNAERFLQRTIA